MIRRVSEIDEPRRSQLPRSGTLPTSIKDLDEETRKKTSSLERRIEKSLRRLHILYYPQYQIGRMHVDFFLPDYRLVVEVDGEYWHSSRRARSRDHRRDSVIKAKGYHVTRIPEKEVLRQPEEAIVSRLYEVIDHDEQSRRSG